MSAAGGAPSDPEAVLKEFAASGTGSQADVSKARQRIQAARMLRAQDDQQRRLSQQQQATADRRQAQGRQQQRQDLRNAQKVAGGVGDLADDRPKPVKFLDDRLGQLPTPGGVGVILIILLVFLFAIIPVNQGYTRLQLFWLTLLGRTELPESGRPGEGSPQEVAPGVFTVPGSVPGGGRKPGGGVTVASASETPNLVGAVAEAVAEAEGRAGGILPQLPFGLPR